jgi:uncharacterized membrane protein required for colicin V production
METLFNIPDIAVAAVALGLGIRGLTRGLSGELAHLVSSLLMGALFIFVFHPAATQLVDDYGLSLWLARTCAVAFIMLATLGFFFLSGFIFKSLIKLGISAVGDKIAGLFCGILHGLLVMIVVLVLAYTIPHDGFYRRVYVNSHSGRFVDQKIMPIADRYLHKPIEIPASLPEKLPFTY